MSAEEEPVTPGAEDQSKLTRLKEKYLKKSKDNDNTNTVALIAAIIAGLGLIFLIVEMVYGLVNYFTVNSPAYYRGIFLSIYGFFFASLLSLAFDGSTKYDKFDIVWSWITGGVALAFSIYILLLEVDRWSDCPPGSEYALDFLICQTYPTQNNTIPWLAIVETVLTVLGFIFLIVIYALYRKWVTADPARDAAIRQGMKNRTSFTIGVLGAISAGLIFLTLLIALFPLDTFSPPVWIAAWYHGTLIVVPAFFAGAEMSYFAVAPKSWQLFVSIVGVIAVVSLGFGTWIEQVRFWQCVLGTGSPSTTDTTICNTNGWRGLWLPWLFLVLLVLELIMDILSWIRWAKKSTDEEKTLTQEEEKEN